MATQLPLEGSGSASRTPWDAPSPDPHSVPRPPYYVGDALRGVDAGSRRGQDALSPEDPNDRPDGLHPVRAELLAVADACGWPELRVDLAERSRPVRIAAGAAPWRAFIRSAHPRARLAAYEALEAWEAERTPQQLGLGE